MVITIVLSNCKFLTLEDKQFISRARQSFVVEEVHVNEEEEEETYCNTSYWEEHEKRTDTPISRRVSIHHR